MGGEDDAPDPAAPSPDPAPSGSPSETEERAIDLGLPGRPSRITMDFTGPELSLPESLDDEGAPSSESLQLDLDEDDRSAYERSLEAPEEAFPMPCGRQSILYTVLGGAAFVGSVLRAYVQGEPFPGHVVFDFDHFLVETA